MNPINAILDRTELLARKIDPESFPLHSSRSAVVHHHHHDYYYHHPWYEICSGFSRTSANKDKEKDRSVYFIALASLAGLVASYFTAKEVGAGSYASQETEILQKQVEKLSSDE